MEGSLSMEGGQVEEDDCDDEPLPPPPLLSPRRGAQEGVGAGCSVLSLSLSLSTLCDASRLRSGEMYRKSVQPRHL